MEDKKIYNYFNKGYINKYDKIYSIFFPKLSLIVNSLKIKKSLKLDFSGNIRDYKKCYIQEYKGKNNLIKKLDDFFKTKNNLDSYLGIYVYGSIADQTENNFSDFDGVIILKDSVLQSSKKIIQIGCDIKKTNELIYSMDPLQHHGWTILFESNLKKFDSSIFPYVVFNELKKITKASKTNLEVKLVKKKNYQKNFINFCNSLEKKIIKKIHKKNLYYLKIILSQFLLIPTLYFEAKNNNQISKKDSFIKLKKELDPKIYKIFDHISMIRSTWNLSNYKINKMLTLPGYIGILSKQYLSPKLSSNLKSEINSQIEIKMLETLNFLKKNI